MLMYEGKPVRPLLDFVRQQGIKIADDISAQGLSEIFQKRWLRAQQHQYQIPEGPPKAEDLDLLKRLGLVYAQAAPENLVFQGALLLGATAPAVRKRLAFLALQYPQVNKIFMLGGARLLDPVKESAEVLCTSGAGLVIKKDWTPPVVLPANEGEMMQMVFQQTVLPPRWQGVFVNAPLQPTEGGGTRNPNTDDTIKELLKIRLDPGNYLVVSGQPFVQRQTLNVLSAVPAEIVPHGIGYSADPATPLATFLDEIARLMYETLKYMSRE